MSQPDIGYTAGRKVNLKPVSEVQENEEEVVSTPPELEVSLTSQVGSFQTSPSFLNKNSRAAGDINREVRERHNAGISTLCRTNAQSVNGLINAL